MTDDPAEKTADLLWHLPPAPGTIGTTTNTRKGNKPMENAENRMNPEDLSALAGGFNFENLTKEEQNKVEELINTWMQAASKSVWSDETSAAWQALKSYGEQLNAKYD